MIAIVRRSTAPSNATNPTSNISVNTWATPKVVSGVFLGCLASVRPLTFSIVISFLFLGEPYLKGRGLVAMYQGIVTSRRVPCNCWVKRMPPLPLFTELPRGNVLGNWALSRPGRERERIFIQGCIKVPAPGVSDRGKTAHSSG